MGYWNKTHVAVAAQDDPNIDSDNDYAEFFFGRPVDIVKVGIMATTAIANAAGNVDIELYRRITPGSSSNEVLLGTFRVTDTTTVAAGKGKYVEIALAVAEATAVDSSFTNVDPTGPYHIEMGETFAMKVVEPSDSGAGYGWVEYVELPLTGTDRTNDYSTGTLV